MIINLIILIFILLLLHYIGFIFYIRNGLGRLIQNDKNQSPDSFVSIIIPFRNEEENILTSLKCVENQNYPQEKYEVIYVNDSSTDNSLKILEEAVTSKNIKVLSVPRNDLERGHKKNAINYGIQNSRGEIIVTTDADCKFGTEWLNKLISGFDEKTAFISGPVKFSEGENIFERIQQIEFAGLVLTGAGLIGNESPVICNAANIAYRRSVFNEVKGFEDNLHLSSGDDELLMQKISSQTNYKVKFCSNKNAVVVTKPNKTIAEFIRQRSRWASKSTYYQNKLLISRLVLIYFFYLSLLVMPLISFQLFILALGAFAVKMYVENMVISKGKELLSIKYNLFELLAAEIFQIIYIVVVSIKGVFGGYKWKERRLQR